MGPGDSDAGIHIFQYKESLHYVILESLHYVILSVASAQARFSSGAW